jgi:hypothetical protein
MDEALMREDANQGLQPAPHRFLTEMFNRKIVLCQILLRDRNSPIRRRTAAINLHLPNPSLLRQGLRCLPAGRQTSLNQISRKDNPIAVMNLFLHSRSQLSQDRKIRHEDKLISLSLISRKEGSPYINLNNNQGRYSTISQIINFPSHSISLCPDLYNLHQDPNPSTIRTIPSQTEIMSVVNI